MNEASRNVPDILSPLQGVGREVHWNAQKAGDERSGRFENSGKGRGCLRVMCVICGLRRKPRSRVDEDVADGHRPRRRTCPNR